MAIKIKTASQLAHYQKLSYHQGMREYTYLREQVAKAGILNPSYNYYTVLFSLNGIGFIYCLYFYITHNNPILLLLTSLALAFFGVQFGGLIHDAGHRAVFKSPKNNDILGYFCSMLLGFAYSNWRIKHNKHHAHANEEDEDPDMQIPFIFTEDQNKPVTGFRKFIVRFQPFLYYPLGSLVVLTIRFKALLYYKDRIRSKFIFEMIFYLIGTFLWIVAPFLIFPFAKALLLVFLANYAAGFYMLNVFAPNHKGMPQIGKGVKFSFIEQQIITSRNIFGNFFTDYIYLGLNYQIEHHLFPACPRNKLHLISPYVRNICRKYGLKYTQASIIGSNRIILSELNSVSRRILKRSR